MTRDGRINVLVFNPGSNSLKFEIVASHAPNPNIVRGEKLVSGVVEPIGENATLSLLEGRKSTQRERLPVKDHGAAAEAVVARVDAGMAASHGIASTRDVHVVGYRVVHGADRYTEPVSIDDDVIRTIEELEDLAPLHNVGALSVIRAVRTKLNPETPAIAVFDTAFHRTIPDTARIYPIPWELTQRYGIQRYGFHGLSHRYLMLRYAELTGTPVEQTNIVTLHLEGGSSATAIVGGRSIDTSMGFTPLEGLMMGTRSGDIDPALTTFLARKENVHLAVIEEWLNKKSGLLGVSGRSQDTREIIQWEASDQRSRLALDMFAYRVRKYIGAYLAAMGKATAIVFGGGIGENSPDIRRRICEGLDWFGLEFDPDRNLATIDCEGRITRDASRLNAFVIPTEEGLMIAHEALTCCGGGPRNG
jgi:acetate kinase